MRSSQGEISGAIWCKSSQEISIFFRERNWPRFSKRFKKKTARAIKTTKKEKNFGISSVPPWIQDQSWFLTFVCILSRHARLQTAKKKNPNHVKGWVTSVSISGGKIVMQFSLDFSASKQRRPKRLKGHAQWPIFMNRSNRCSFSFRPQPWKNISANLNPIHNLHSFSHIFGNFRTAFIF